MDEFQGKVAVITGGASGIGLALARVFAQARMRIVLSDRDAETLENAVADLKSTGGRASIIVQFFSDGYLSDEIPSATLAKLVELELALAIECFTD